MRIVVKPKHIAGIILGSLILISDIIFFFSFRSPIGPKVWYFSPILVIALLFGTFFFFLDFLKENNRQKEIEEKFLEFVRSLVEVVRSGVSLPQAIIQISQSDFGALTPFVKKLSNKLQWGYSLHDALEIFSKDAGNDVITRSISIVTQAEKSGGDIASVLEAVTQAVLEIKKIKEDQKTNSYSQMVQGYIIFFVFIAIMLVMQLYLIPKLSGISAEISQTLSGSGLGAGGSAQDMGSIFLATIVIQGFFAGLLIGKFSEGKYKVGIKHSVIMVLSSYLIMSTMSGIFESLVLLMPLRINYKRWTKKG